MAGIVLRVAHDKAFPMLRHPARNAIANLETKTYEAFRAGADGFRAGDFSAILRHQPKRGGHDMQKLLDFRQGGFEHVAQFER